MASIHAVIDTNILVSAIIAKRQTSAPAQILQAVLENKVNLITAEPLVLELAEVLNRKHIAKLHQRTPAQVNALVTAIAEISTIVTVHAIPPVSSDPDDDILFACAIAGNSHYIVTGDKKHVLALDTHKGIKVVTAQQFLQLL